MTNKYFALRKFILVIITIIILLVALLGWKLYSDKTNSNLQPSQINSFDECVAAGNAIMESYPEQCAANGKIFTKQY